METFFSTPLNFGENLLSSTENIHQLTPWIPKIPAKKNQWSLYCQLKKWSITREIPQKMSIHCCMKFDSQKKWVAWKKKPQKCQPPGPLPNNLWFQLLWRSDENRVRRGSEGILAFLLAWRISFRMGPEWFLLVQKKHYITGKKKEPATRSRNLAWFVLPCFWGNLIMSGQKMSWNGN